MILGLAAGLVAKLLLGGGVLAYIYSLYYKFQQLAQKTAQAEAQAKIQDDLNKVAQEAKNVQESTRDYSQSVDDFNKRNPS